MKLNGRTQTNRNDYWHFMANAVHMHRSSVTYMQKNAFTLPTITSLDLFVCACFTVFGSGRAQVWNIVQNGAKWMSSFALVLWFNSIRECSHMHFRCRAKKSVHVLGVKLYVFFFHICYAFFFAHILLLIFHAFLL